MESVSNSRNYITEDQTAASLVFRVEQFSVQRILHGLDEFLKNENHSYTCNWNSAHKHWKWMACVLAQKVYYAINKKT